LPGLMGASTWMKFSLVLRAEDSDIGASRALTIPCVLNRRIRKGAAEGEDQIALAQVVAVTPGGGDELVGVDLGRPPDRSWDLFRRVCRQPVDRRESDGGSCGIPGDMVVSQDNPVLPSTSMITPLPVPT